MKKNILPNHIGIIMDGNGRWAKNKGLNRTEGHKKGSEVLKNTVLYLAKKKINYLSLYAFSTENWKRSPSEVKFLMNYSRAEIGNLRNIFDDANVKIVWSGSKNKLPKSVMRELEKAVLQTKNNTGMVLNICLNYGGRKEIIDAFNSFPKDKKITEKNFSNYFYNKLPDTDLIVRTSGEKRISNFLLWQSAYAEFFFADTLWPDFNDKIIGRILNDFKNRNRRFGKDE